MNDLIVPSLARHIARIERCKREFVEAGRAPHFESWPILGTVFPDEQDLYENFWKHRTRIYASLMQGFWPTAGGATKKYYEDPSEDGTQKEKGGTPFRGGRGSDKYEWNP